MKPEVGKWYRYKWYGKHDHKGNYLYDVFQVISTDNRNCIDRGYSIRKKSIIDDESYGRWIVSPDYWDKYVKEITEEEVMVEAL